MTNTLPRKTSLTLGLFALMAAALLIPLPKHAAMQPAVVEKRTVPPLVPATLTVTPGSLDAFYAALQRIDSKAPGAGVRILHYGDSPTTADSITADIRRLLQQRFGDAGHGFVLIAKPWAWYGHDKIGLDAKGWRIEPASQTWARDGIHGPGGVSFTGQTGAVSRVTLPDSHYSRAVVYYLAEPAGGRFTATSGDTKIIEVDTAAEEKHLAFAEFDLPPGTATLELNVTSGNVRLFGYRLDKDQPGVQYSSLGVNGAQVQMVVRHFEVNQWTEALRHENPDLVVLNYGTNESLYPEYIVKEYPDELRTVIARIRKALPQASLLLMGPMDRGIANAGGDVSTPEALENLIAVQKNVAAETGCAFFDTFHAMGGAGTMGRWYHATPRLVSADFMHPLPAGAAIIGKLFEEALMQGYQTPQAGVGQPTQ